MYMLSFRGAKICFWGTLNTTVHMRVIFVRGRLLKAVRSTRSLFLLLRVPIILSTVIVRFIYKLTSQI